jgi:magnesium-transporting ATPase (P-type)
MITGDHALTACQVAAELQITTRDTLILQAAPLQWQKLDGTVVEPFSASKSSYSALAAKHDFCLTGETVSALGYVFHSPECA